MLADHRQPVSSFQDHVGPRNEGSGSTADDRHQAALWEAQFPDLETDELPLGAVSLERKGQIPLIPEKHLTNRLVTSGRKPILHEAILLDTGSKLGKQAEVPSWILLRADQIEDGVNGLFLITRSSFQIRR